MASLHLGLNTPLLREMAQLAGSPSSQGDTSDFEKQVCTPGHWLTPHSKQRAAPAWHGEQGARTMDCTATRGVPAGAKPLVHSQVLRCQEVSTEANSITSPFRSKHLYHRDRKKDTSVLQR